MNINNFVQKDETPALIDTSTAGVIYMGYPARESSATSAAEWAIKKIVFTAGATGGVYETKLWANRTTEKTSIWDNRKTTLASTYKVVLEDNTTDWASLISVASSFSGPETPSGTTSSGGSTSVSADYKSPADFTAVYTSGDTITLSGLPITITDDAQIVYIKYISSVSASGILVNGQDGVYITHSAGVLTVAGDWDTNPFASTHSFEVGINAQVKGYDSSTQSYLHSQLNPDYSHYTDIEATAYASTGATTAFYHEFSMESFKNFYLQLGGTNIDFTIEATGDDSLWDDVSTLILGAASYSTTTAAHDSFFGVDMMPLKFRVKCTPTNTTNATTINLRRY